MRSPLPNGRPVSPKELADALGCSVERVWRQIRDGEIQTVPLGRPYIIPDAEVRRLLVLHAH